MTAGSVGHRTGPFIATKEHRRFTEFAYTIRQHRTIGVCFGPAGVAKPSQPAAMHTGIWLNRCCKPGGHASPPMQRCLPPWHAPGRFSIPQPSAKPCVSSVKTCI